MLHQFHNILHSITSFLLLCFIISQVKIIQVAQAASSGNSLNPNLEYHIYPLREQEKAAIVEWGNSAIISALDAAVADFGVHTSQSAFFEVETSPVLASPIDGKGDKAMKYDEGEVQVPYPGPLDNKDETYGNMVVMTNYAGMSGVQMAKIAKESGAAALMVVNVDNETPDFIYSLEAENDAERKYADEHIDFPVFMVSLASGNLITTATVEEGMKEEDIVNNGMPDRVRLYAAEDRPFFEDVSNQSPVLYLIHNLLTQEECEMLLQQAQGKYDLVDDSKNNLLENIVAEPSKKAINIERTMIWKGQLNNHAGTQVEERISQVTGYPQDLFSDWHITKHVKGSKHELHYDHHPMYAPVATITVFLNDLDDDDAGGEIVFPNPVEGSPVMIMPKSGLAVVHHNTDYEGNVDYSAVYGEMNLRSESEVKYIARKYIYAEALPKGRRLLLPLIAFPTGGKLPRFVVSIHDFFVENFGIETGSMYFEKALTFTPVLILFIIGLILQRLLQSKLRSMENPTIETANKLKKSGSGKKKGKKAKKFD